MSDSTSQTADLMLLAADLLERYDSDVNTLRRVGRALLAELKSAPVDDSAASEPAYMQDLRNCHPNEELRAYLGGRKCGFLVSATTIARDWDSLARSRDRYKAAAEKWHELAMSFLSKLEAAHLAAMTPEERADSARQHSREARS